MSFVWPDNHRLAFCLVLSIEDATADSASTADLQYGLRAAFPRIAELLGEYSVKATFRVSAELLDSEELLRDFIASRRHEAYFTGVGAQRTPYRFAAAMDDRPHSSEGQIYLPLLEDCSDQRFLGAPALTPDAWLQYAIDSFDVLYAESEHTPQMFAVPLHAHIIGRPGRINALEQLLQYVSSREDIWIATGGEIAAYFDVHQQETHA